MARIFRFAVSSSSEEKATFSLKARGSSVMVQSQGEKIHLSIYCVQQRRLSGGLTKISRTICAA